MACGPRKCGAVEPGTAGLCGIDTALAEVVAVGASVLIRVAVAYSEAVVSGCR